jgi:hypothetical protein
MIGGFGDNRVDHSVVCSGKNHYRTAGAAWEALRRFERRQKARGKKARDHSRNDQGIGLSPYRCRCGQGWALGHASASSVASGRGRR